MDFGGGGTGYPLMRRSSSRRGVVVVECLIPLVDKGTSFASISFAGGGKSQITPNLVFAVDRGGISGETVISREGGLLDAASVPARGELVGDFGIGGGMESTIERSQLRLMVVNFLVSSGESGDSEGIVTTRNERSRLVMI